MTYIKPDLFFSHDKPDREPTVFDSRNLYEADYPGKRTQTQINLIRPPAKINAILKKFNQTEI